MVAWLAIPAYSAAKIASGYRHHRDAYVDFAARVLQTDIEAAAVTRGSLAPRSAGGDAGRYKLGAQPSRFVVIGGEDEGLLLYLRKTEFTLPADAVEAWKRHDIEAIVTVVDELPPLMRALPDAAESPIGLSGAAGAHRNRYALLVRK